MKAYLQTLEKCALPKIDETMKRMEAMAEKYNRPELQPDTVTYYYTFMNAVVRQGAPGCAGRVEKMLSSIEPDQISYNVAMNAWAKSGSPEAPERVASLLKSMDSPDMVSNYILLNFFSKQGKHEKALSY
jgi:hypothetical protein